MSTSVLLVLSLLGPASADEAAKDAPDPEAQAGEPTNPALEDPAPSSPDADPYAEQAPLDVKTLLTDSSKAYLEARARLEAHPELAADAILDRLAAVPAPGPAEHKRLLDVLAALGLEEHVELFARELRRAVVTAATPEEAEAAASRWRPLLTEQGATALPHLQQLVGDRKLPERVRVALVQDMVTVAPTDTLGDLVVLIGRGQRALSQALQLAMVQRAKRDEAARAAMVSSTDTALDRALDPEPDERELGRLPALLAFRAAVSKGPDVELSRRLSEIAGNAEARFGARVAAVRGLGVLDEPESGQALETIARRELLGDKRNAQASEILGWLALRGIDPQRARVVIDELRLLGDDAPRLSVLAYRLGSLPPRHGWLSAGLADPWPQVRQAALSRVEGPCDKDTIELLVERGGPTDKGGDDDRAVARNAVQALGRCGGDRALDELEDLLDSDRVDLEQRAEAARQLTKRGGPRGADAVAKVLDDPIESRLARRLATALRYADAPTADVDGALCRRLDDEDAAVVRAAAESLRELHPEKENPCN